MVGQLPEPGFHDPLSIHFCVAHSAAALTVLLGRRRLLHSGRSRHPAYWKSDPAFYSFKPAPTPCNRLPPSLVEGDRLRPAGDPHAAANSRRFFSRVSFYLAPPGL